MRPLPFPKGPTLGRLLRERAAQSGENRACPLTPTTAAAVVPALAQMREEDRGRSWLGLPGNKGQDSAPALSLEAPV